MRRVLVCVLVLAGAAAAPASAAPRLMVSPARVAYGDEVLFRGGGWPVFESCSRTVSLTLRAGRDTYGIGRVRTRRDGTFRHRWAPRAAAVGTGVWRVVARLRCESGEDGSALYVRRDTTLRIEA
ncbi:MAG TPA: hypothetical protein VNZ62_10930 [Capillimicrobium sp.]|nr:hypothetical protein [Capillimicrobium sp.]